MFGKRNPADRGSLAPGARVGETEARGGVSLGAILTGVVVAFGAMTLFSALVAGVLGALGVVDTDVTRGDLVDAGIGAGIALVAVQFLSYLWGGYTAGRMGRGAGVVNGILVPLTALILAAVTGGIIAALGANVDLNLNLPFNPGRIAEAADNYSEWGIGLGIAALVAMFLGGALGGGAGQRWHTKLERDAYDPTTARGKVTTTDVPAAGATTETRDPAREVDIRDREPAATAHPSAGGDTTAEGPPTTPERGKPYR